MTRLYQRVFSAMLLIVIMFSGVVPGLVRTAKADSTAFALCTGTTANVFSQNWTNTGLITTNDDWSGVPSIVGYRGDGMAGAAGVDPQTVTGNGTVVVDVNATQTAPNTFSTGGVTEFEIPNPTIALAGSGTARGPHIVITLNSTGTSATTIAYTVRDIDGSVDNATQQFNVQYRIGITGGWTNVPGGYIADASVGPSLTQDTPVAAYALPALINNAGTVQIRFMTMDATGNDEWLGIDDIVITPTCNPDPCASVIFPYTLPDNTPATLRTAMQCANANGTADIIDFNGQTVTLTEIYGDFDGATGLPRITSDITLRNGTITRSGANEFRLLSASNTATLRLDDLTLSNGGGAAYASNGAGVNSSGSLYLTEVTMTGHQSTVGGGAIAITSLQSGAVVDILNSTLSNNTALGGSAFYFSPTVAGTATITSSTIANNVGTGGPGAVFVSGTGAALTVRNTTFSANSSTNTAAPDAIGVFSSASASIAFTTFSGHDNGSSASTVGIIHAASSASVNMQASVIANNIRTGGGTARECTTSSATFTGTRNYTADSFCPDRVATPLYVSTTLANNGGPTQTHLPAPHSNVMNNDTGNLCGPANFNLTTDQRGEPRPLGPVCDIGAVELDACGSITFPYTLPDNAPATLNAAIDCANSTTSTNDIIELNGQTITLTVTSGDVAGETGLVSVYSPITIQNGTITRTGSNQFRLLGVNLNGNLTLRDMTLTNGGGSTYGDGGGLVYAASGSTLTIIRSTLTGGVGSTGSSGGAIFASGALTIVNSTVSGNQGGRGGAITAQNGPVTITNSVISGNVATNTTSSGGGAMFLASITVNDVRIINSTITGNYATGTGTARAGGIVGDSSNGADLFIINSVVWGNSNNGGAAPQIVNAASNATNTATNSIIQGGLFGALDSDPLFTTPLTASATPSTAGSFALQNNSPAIDAGANADVPADTYDVNGNSNTSENAPDRAYATRRYNDTGVTDTGSGTAPIVDIGAYEKQTNSPTGPCVAITFPYTLPDNAPATLITAIECANANGASADTINLNGQTVTLTASYATYSGATGLPQITTNITLRNGTITRTGSNEFRFLNVSNTGNLTVRDMTFTNGGGTTYAANGGSILSQGTASVLTVVNTTLSGSRVDGIQNGSAIYSNAIFTIVNSRVIGNGLGRGAIASINGPALIQNTLVAGNSAFDTTNGGGGVYFGNILSATIVNSTITGNYVGTTLNTQPGGVLASGGTINLTIRNSIIWGNSNNGNTAPQVVNTTSGTNTITNSIIQGGLFGALNADPLFVTPITASGTPSTAGDFALQNNSPAIDAGANADVPADTFDVNGNSNTSEDAPDLANNPRRYNDTGVTDTGSGTAPIVDIGAYEKQTNTPNPCAAYVFPYTLTGNTPAELIEAIECANANGTADTINLNNQTVTLTDSYASYTGATGLPQITTQMTLQNGTITRGGGNQFRLMSVGVSGNLTLNNIIATNGYGLAPGNMGGGGAIYNLGALNIVGGQFSSNYSALDGGAIHNDGGAVNARYTVFSGNSSNTSLGGVGAGLANSFGVVTLSNVLISGNLAVQGAGIYNNNGGTLTLNNSTIAGNSTNDQGAGLRNENTAASVVLNNTIISGNESSLFPATSDVGGSITNNASLVGGSPSFVAPLDASDTAPTTSGDYRLADFSPAIDAGDNSLVPGIISTDLDGSPRFYNDTGVTDTGVGTAPIVDMGAYEKQTNSIVDPCLSITFPYTLPNNLAATLITAIECANANGASADTIDLNSQIVTLTATYADYTGATGLPQITTDITLENGVITRSGGAPQFRLLNVGAAGNLTVDGVTLSGGSLSSSDNAGAIFNSGTLNILNSTVTNNSAGFGGALYNNGSATVITITNSTLSNNSATQNAGFMMNDSGSATITGSTVSGNSSSGPSGNGAIYNFEADLDIIDSIFATNSSTSFVGAIQNFNGTTNIANSIFTANSATHSIGAVVNNSAGMMTITNSRFTGNNAGTATGALLNNALSTLIITNSTFAGNNAPTNGGIHITGSSITTITNSIIWGNNGNTLTGATITYSIVEGGFAGTGNLNVDPLFVAPVAFASAPTSVGNYRLQDTSPAVDAGSNAAVPVDTYDLNDNASTTDEAPDLDGDPRRYNDTGVTDTGSGTAPIVDMGAYEKQTNTPVAAVDFCNLQFPTSFTLEGGSPNTSPLIYGWIYEDDGGILTSAGGAHPSIVGQVGYGPLGSDPTGNGAWTWVTSTFNTQIGNDDEYQGSFFLPAVGTPTQYSYTTRFSIDSGATFTYCDSDGNGTNSGLSFSTAQLGTMTVLPSGVNYCALQSPTSFTAASGTLSPVIYGRVYEDDAGVLTSTPGAHPSIIGQVGYGPLSSTPIGNASWQWFSTTYNIQVGNDDEYQGTFTVPFAPTNTQLSYTYRFSVDSGATYTYCDSNGNGTDSGLSFSTANLGTLTINPGGQPTISINDVSQNEGNSGSTNFNFTVSLNGPSLSAVTFDIGTQDNTATVANSDYVANSATGFVIPAGQTSTTFTVLVNGDTTVEPSEAFFVNLTNVVNATTLDGQGVGVIVNDDVAPQADLSITKTDGVTTAIPGSSVTYTITASNAGPSNANGATVADTFPANITSATWTCVGAGGGTCTASGSGNISDTVNLPAGGSVTYTVNATISPSATGTLSNTATVAAPGGVTDPVPGNNSATDTDTLTPQADLAITKTDGVTTAIPGGSVTYTITASNTGPSNVNAATVADTFPAVLTATWTCVGAGGGTCTASGSGNISDTVNLPAGGSVTYTVSATISPSATGTLSNTATVAAPGGVTDPVPGNNSATDTDTLTPQADLAITKTDGVTTAIPGSSVTYTITASNAGPSNANGATVADTFPAVLTATWTCVGAGGGTCTASGSGNINDTVNLPAGGSVTYTVNATISPTATGTLSNTATVSSAVTDPVPGNNSATDTDTLTPQADLSITKTDGVTTAIPGGSVTYTITASNTGPSNVNAATVADTFPAVLTATWTCVGAGGGTCTASGSGNINDTVNLPAGGSVTYTVNTTISPTATGTLSNTATVSSAVTDPVPGNNSATDTDTLTPQADLAITKTDGVTTAIPGSSVTYTITASNTGPSNVNAATVADTFPAVLTATWTCVGAGGGTCTASGSGNINDTVNLPAGGSVTYTVNATISPTATGTLSNTATVSSAVTDPVPGNNSATDVDTLTAPADITITPTTVNVTEGGATDTYTLVLDAPPSANVTVELSYGGQIVVSTDGTNFFPSPMLVTFTTVNWNSPRTITVQAVDDAVAEGAHNTSVDHDLTSADPLYNGLSGESVDVNITDNDTAGVTFTGVDTGTLLTENSLSGDSYTVQINTTPSSGNAIIVITSDADCEISINGSLFGTSGTITTNDPLAVFNVEVRAVNDRILEGNHTCTVSYGFNTSTAPEYASITRPNDVYSSITDNETAIYGLIRADGTVDLNTTASESVTSAAIAMALQVNYNGSSGPIGIDSDFSIGYTQTGGSATGGGVDYSFTNGSISFLTTDTFTNLGYGWLVKPINFTVVNDTLAEATETVVITADPNESGTSGTYDVLISVSTGGFNQHTYNITDDDAPVLTQSATTVNVTESGTTDTYTLTLSNTDTGVTTNTTITAGADCEVSLNGSTFFPSVVATLSNTATTITVRAIDDLIAEGTHTCTISHSNTSGSSVSVWNGIVIADVTATVTDNDAAGVVITENSGTPNDNAITVTEGGAGSSFAVVLTSQPASDVQVSMTFNGSIIEAGSPTLGNAPFSIMFTSANWNTPQIVNVGAVNDNIEVNHGSTNLSLVVGSADPNYTSIATQPASPIVVTIIEDDAAGVVITENSGTPNDNAITVTEGGAGSSFAVVLTSQPASDVQVSMTFNGSIIEAGSPTLGNAPFSIMFTNANWNTPQIVNVGAVNDNIEVNHGSTNLSLVVGSTDPNYTSIATQPASPIVVTIIEDDTAGVTVTPTTVTATEGGATGSYTVVLNTQPTADVTVTVTGDAQASASPATLTFTTSNWNIAQTVTVTAVDDVVVEGAHTATITHSAAGGGYNAVSIASVTVNITDNDVAGVTVTPTTVTATEGGATGSYTVVLNTQPTADVTITVTGDAQASASPATLTFTTSDWNSAQTVTVTATDDAIAEGAHTATITHSAAGGGYNAVSIASVTVNITDNDAAGVVITENSDTPNDNAITVMEGGAGSSFEVVLTSQPASDVQVSMTFNGTIIQAGSPTLGNAPFSITFTSANWNTPQIVNVGAINDNVEVNHGSTNLSLVVGSTDPNYTSIATQPVSPIVVTIIEDDDAGVVITENSGTPNDNAITVTEGGAGSSFEVVLTSQPASDVQVSMTFNGTIIQAGSPTLGNAPFSITFTSANWNTPQIVNVGAINDNIEVNYGSTNLSLVVGSTDPNYTSIATQPVSPIVVTIIEDDDVGVTVTPTTVTATEGGATGSYTVVLNTQPTADVTITVTGDAQANASPATLTFTTGNWNIGQTVTVTATDDAVVEGAHTANITHSAAGGGYTGVTIASVTVNITDNDTVGVTVTPTIITATEGGATGSYTVVLNTQPTADVTITVTGDAQANASPATLTFTTGNWNSAQTVTVTATDDVIAEGAHTATITHSATGGGYTGVTIASVTVNITDNDTVGVTVTPTTITATEGGATGSYTVVLNTQPTADVTITVTGDAQASASPATLTFTTGNWNIAQTVTVTATDDAVVEGAHTATITHSTAGGGYNAVSIASVTVNITDNDVALGNLLLNPSFEDVGTKPRNAMHWKGRNLTVKDRRQCTSVTAADGTCVFQFSFVGPSNVSRSVKQVIIAPTWGEIGDTLTLTASVSGQQFKKDAKMVLQVVYTDGTKSKVVTLIPTKTYGYVDITGTLELTKPIQRVIVNFNIGLAGGRLWIDDVELLLNASLSPRDTASTLLPLPAAPDGFRGGN